MILKNFIQFVLELKPNHRIIKLNSKKFFALLGFNLLILFFIEAVEGFIMLPDFHHAIDESIEDIFEMSGFFLFWVGIIIPVVEEFIFRYFLVEMNFYKVLPAIFIILFYSIFTFNGLDFYDILNLFCLTYFLIVIIYLIFSFKLNSKFIIISSIILFGTYHLSNFQFVELKINYIYLPIIILPQLILGYILVFLRINIGLIYAVFYHSAYNVFLMMIIYFLYWFT